MSVTFDPAENRYFVCPQCGPAAMGYGNFTVGNCYGGDCSTLCGNPSGPYFQCAVRERLRDFYANGVQGGTPACKNERTDAQAVLGLRPAWATYALNWFGDDDKFRQRPYDTGYANVGIATTGGNVPASDYEAFGHYVQNSCLTGSCQTTPTAIKGAFGCSTQYQQPLLILPVPGVPSAKTLDSMAFPGMDNVCTRAI